MASYLITILILLNFIFSPAICFAQDDCNCNALKDRLELHIKYLDKALVKADVEMQRRLLELNEYKKTMARYVTRAEGDLIHNKIEEKLDRLERMAFTQTGATKWSDHLVTVGIGFIVVMLVWRMRDAKK